MRRSLVGVIAILIAIIAALAIWWWRPVARTRSIATLAATADQRRLWEQVSHADARLLYRLPVDYEPIEPRRPPGAAPQPAPRRGGGTTAGAASRISLVSSSRTGAWDFAGQAKVIGTSGERVDVDLAPGTLSFAARINGKPLPVAKGDLIDLRVRSRPGPYDRNLMLAVRTASGGEIGLLLESGPMPVSATLPLPSGDLLASQTGGAANGAIPVTIVRPADKVKEDMKPGTTRQVGSISVLLLQSIALPARLEGQPYVIDLIAWRTK